MNDKIKKLIFVSCMALVTAHLLYAMQPEESLLQRCVAYAAQNLGFFEANHERLPLELQNVVEHQVRLNWGWELLQGIQAEINIKNNGKQEKSDDGDYSKFYRRKIFSDSLAVVTWGNNNDIVIVCGGNKTCIVDSDTLEIKEIIPWEFPLQEIQCLDNFIVGLSNNRVISLFDLQSKALFHRYEHGAYIADIIASSNKKEIVFCDVEHEMHFWDIKLKSLSKSISLASMYDPCIVPCQTNSNCYALVGRKHPVNWAYNCLQIVDRDIAKSREIPFEQSLCGVVFPNMDKIILIPYKTDDVFMIKSLLRRGAPVVCEDQLVQPQEIFSTMTHPTKELIAIKSLLHNSVMALCKNKTVQSEEIVSISSHPTKKLIGLALQSGKMLLWNWEYNLFTYLEQKTISDFDHPLRFNHDGTKLLDVRQNIVSIWDTNKISYRAFLSRNNKRAMQKESTE